MIPKALIYTNFCDMLLEHGYPNCATEKVYELAPKFYEYIQTQHPDIKISYEEFMQQIQHGEMVAQMQHQFENIHFRMA